MQRQTRPLLLAGRIYGLLLRAYPAAFRQEYSYHMAQLFRDEMRATVQERGTAGLVGLWLITFLDLLKTAAAEHIWELLHLSPGGFSRRSGLAAMLGSVMFYGGVALGAGLYLSGLSFGPAGFLAILGAVVLSLPLLGLALFGLYRRLGRGAVAGLALVAAEVGLFGYIAGILALFTTSWPDQVLAVIVAGSVLLGLGLLGLGGTGLAGRSLGWWSVGPLLLGAGHVGFALSSGRGSGQTVPLLSMIILVIGWFLVGAALWTGPAEDRQPGLPA
jgi:hypothetical protein